MGTMNLIKSRWRGKVGGLIGAPRADKNILKSAVTKQINRSPRQTEALLSFGHLQRVCSFCYYHMPIKLVSPERNLTWLNYLAKVNAPVMYLVSRAYWELVYPGTYKEPTIWDSITYDRHTGQVDMVIDTTHTDVTPYSRWLNVYVVDQDKHVISQTTMEIYPGDRQLWEVTIDPSIDLEWVVAIQGAEAGKKYISPVCWSMVGL